MKYNLDNPSDPYTLSAEDFDVATVACFLLGGGRYGLTPMGSEGGRSVPIFLLGGSDAWARETFNKSVGDLVSGVLGAKRQALIDCLRGLELRSGRVSSMNDIGARARRYAEELEATKCST